MSGSAGGNRIPREAVENTVKDYTNKVLSKFPGFKKAKVTGSYNTSNKQDFGDIDLIVQIEGKDKKQIKLDLAKFLSSLSDSEIVPFKSDKYKGKKTLNSGELVTILYPITGMEGQYVQIDNIISISEEEAEFKNTFLDYPADIQGLLLGLTKVICLEEDPKDIFRRLSINNVPELIEGQEYEFNLSSQGLTLRIVTLTPDFKETDRTEVWKSSNWSVIKKLFQNFNIDSDFNTLLKDLSSKIKNPRSKNRIKGIFKSMVSVKSGEVGTPKGDSKVKSLDDVDKLLEGKLCKGLVRELIAPFLFESTDGYNETIAFIPGGYKPPTLAHFHIVDEVSKRPEIDKVEVLIGHKERDGFTKEQSLEIWGIYKKYLNDKVEIKLSSSPAPIKEIIDTVKANPQNYYILVFGRAEDAERFKSAKAYPNTKVINFKDINNVSGTKAREAILSNNFNNLQRYLPTELTDEERKKIWKISTGKQIKEDKIPGGLAAGKTLEDIARHHDEKGYYDVEDFISTLKIQLEKGIKVEMEHTTSKAVAKEIAMDHLWEDPAYYTHLEKIELKESQETISEFEEALLSLIKYMIDQGMDIKPLPKINIINDDEENAFKLLGRTAYYDPNDCSITLYTLDRHPKDILRSFSHEMIHRQQDNEDRLQKVDTTNTNEDGPLKELEEEAYLKGNMIFRNWEDSLKND